MTSYYFCFSQGSKSFHFLTRHPPAKFSAYTIRAQELMFPKECSLFCCLTSFKNMFSFFSLRKYDPLLEMLKDTNITAMLNFPILTSGKTSKHKRLCDMKVKVHRKLLIILPDKSILL